MIRGVLLGAAGVAALMSSGAYAQARPSGTQKTQAQMMQDVPRCVRKLGTISVVDGDDPSGWTQYSLAPPQKLLKVLIQRSGCFNLVDRGSGLQAAQLERGIGGDLGLQRGSNVGQGQIKAADYVLVAEVQAANRNSGGSAVGGAIGGLIGGRFGALAGGIGSRKMEANTVLSITNVRTTETIAVTDGYAAKNSISFGAGGGTGFLGGGLGAVGGGYDNTDIGRIVTLAFIQAYAKMVNELGLVTPGDAGTAQAAPTKTFTAQAPVAMRVAALATAKAIRTLPPGAIVYPTGNKNGLWWEVADENDNVGWVLNTKLAPSM
ncbi:CsgG/HfaB family protein [Sphingomonas sp.]|uniref:CsgG/HfaB family protein n=1 Tax=Sphingomonas sp. TaxID=28214 RepID=UPI0035C830D1